VYRAMAETNWHVEHSVLVERPTFSLGIVTPGSSSLQSGSASSASGMHRPSSTAAFVCAAAQCRLSAGLQFLEHVIVQLARPLRTWHLLYGHLIQHNRMHAHTEGVCSSKERGYLMATHLLHATSPALLLHLDLSQQHPTAAAAAALLPCAASAAAAVAAATTKTSCPAAAPAPPAAAAAAASRHLRPPLHWCHYQC
jgi:hypothetical protein